MDEDLVGHALDPAEISIGKRPRQLLANTARPWPAQPQPESAEAPTDRHDSIDREAIRQQRDRSEPKPSAELKQEDTRADR
jgi:hypothetical protein